MSIWKLSLLLALLLIAPGGASAQEAAFAINYVPGQAGDFTPRLESRWGHDFLVLDQTGALHYDLADNAYSVLAYCAAVIHDTVNGYWWFLGDDQEFVYDTANPQRPPRAVRPNRARQLVERGWCG